MVTTTVLDDAQVLDHSGRAVPPLTGGGLPYRYRLRGRGLASYTTTADEVLAMVIEDYPEPPISTATDALDRYDEAAHDARVLHAFGVITTLVTDALISGTLDADEEAVLQRSAERGPNSPPITVDDCRHWNHPDVPMVLLTVLYDQSFGRRPPPAGNVIFIDPGVPETYVADLHRLGVIELTTNPAYRPGRLTEIFARHDKARSG